MAIGQEWNFKNTTYTTRDTYKRPIRHVQGWIYFTKYDKRKPTKIVVELFYATSAFMGLMLLCVELVIGFPLAAQRMFQSSDSYLLPGYVPDSCLVHRGRARAVRKELMEEMLVSVALLL